MSRFSVVKILRESVCFWPEMPDYSFFYRMSSEFNFCVAGPGEGHRLLQRSLSSN